MALTDDLISQFVKITNDKKDVKTESTVYGTIRIKDGKTFVRLDGASDDEILTPVTAAANAIEGERVTVMIKNHTAVVTGNLSSPLARSGDVADAVNETIHEFNDLLAQKVSTEELDAERARIDDLVADNATIKGLLEANDIDVGQLQADYITVNNALTAVQADVDNLSTSKLDAEIAKVTYAAITDLEATNVEVHNLQATYGEFAALTANHFTAIDANINALTADKLDAETARLTYATIAELDATNAEIDKLSASVADIDTLMFGSATGSTIQTSFANAVIAQLGDAQIKAAMIESVSASQITAGDIITNNVRVRSEDGSLVISDETIQISDLSRVRVQIGKDATGDYSINVWDQNGNLMFSEGGITDSAIKDAIIRNDMVSDTANIAAHKLDIDSLFEEINGSANTIKSTKIYLDDEAQTLDVAFKALETDVNGLGSTVSSQGTQLSILQGNISSKIWQQDIDDVANDMSTQYSVVEQRLNSINTTIASHDTQIANKADANTVTTVSDRVTSLEADLDGFQSSVSATYATTKDNELAQSTAETAQATATTAETLVRQLSDSISTLVTDGNGTSLMTQTDSGWTFSTAKIHAAIASAAENLDALNTELGDTNHTVDVLQQAVADLGEIAEYVKIGTYEDEPCIELGEGDSEFKLRITNTQILFMEGSSVIAHFTNQSLHIKKAVIEEELQQGEFVWKARSNGNLGLIWKGVNS